MSGVTSSVELIKLTLCGPTDVAKEMALAAEAINDWNCQHGEQRGFWVKHQHWSTDSYPDAQETGQGAINKQLIAIRCDNSTRARVRATLFFTVASTVEQIFAAKLRNSTKCGANRTR
jgi:hypothetical protein